MQGKSHFPMDENPILSHFSMDKAGVLSHFPMDSSALILLDTQNTRTPHTPLMKQNRTRHTFLK